MDAQQRETRRVLSNLSSLSTCLSWKQAKRSSGNLVALGELIRVFCFSSATGPRGY